MRAPPCSHPFPDLGLIIVDEEHDPTYKQEDRDFVITRGILRLSEGESRAPSYCLDRRRRVWRRARGSGRDGCSGSAGAADCSWGLPAIEIVDLGEEERLGDIQAPLAKKTLEAIQQTLANGDQAMIFLNRRGFAAFLLCQDCGEVRECPNCSISLTVHFKRHNLKCHVCGHQEPIPDICSKCQSAELQPMGAGTESLELDLPKLIPEARILRLDRDQVTSATRLESVLENFVRERQLALGTQMLVKGHDFPGVTLVVVILADALFRWPDFRATERSYQILKQVSGRAGRGERAGRVLIQTFDPENAVIQAVRGTISEETLLAAEKDARKALGYPPFGRMARLRFESPTPGEARDRSTLVARQLQDGNGVQSDIRSVQVLGPSEAFLEKAKGIYRWDIVLKSPEIGPLQKAIHRAKELSQSRKWSVLVDVDPYGVG